jgi:hypothetical protein
MSWDHRANARSIRVSDPFCLRARLQPCHRAGREAAFHSAEGWSEVRRTKRLIYWFGCCFRRVSIDDVQPFLPIEEKATLEQLLAARSGTYLPSGDTNLDPLTPKRVSQYPGTFFDYNNWDCAAAGPLSKSSPATTLWSAFFEQ